MNVNGAKTHLARLLERVSGATARRPATARITTWVPWSFSPPRRAASSTSSTGSNAS